MHAERCVCAHCSSEWPITGGIPRFFRAPDYNCGDVLRSEAREMLAAARSGLWADAVRTRFAGNQSMFLGVLGLQRASWLPMLGLDETSVALEIGCGYGAVTQSIAREIGEVYAVDDVPERIEFTQERLRQEGIRNVHLYQASPAGLPFSDESFDLIVADGVLGWIGEWNRQDHPRNAQMKFLSRINRLLKKDGVLVMGIENRLGYGRYRAAAHRKAGHHRANGDAGVDGRGYAHSEHGYRKLLSRAGFRDVSCYWASPGYSRPYHLIPTNAPKWIRERLQYGIDHPDSGPQRNWRRRLRRSIARWGLPSLFANDFVFIASRAENRRTKLDEWLEACLTADSNERTKLCRPSARYWELHTGPFALKSTLRVASGDGSTFVMQVQLSPNGLDKPRQTSRDLKVLKDLFEKTASTPVRIPRALGELRHQSFSYRLESFARGESLASLVREPGYFKNMRKAWSILDPAIAGAVELSRTLQDLHDVRLIDPGWLAIPKECGDSGNDIGADTEMARYFAHAASFAQMGWVQHGDLSIENVFLEAETGKIEVFDWADLAAGFPPLYDLFTLLSSTGYLAPADERRRFPNESERWIASFEAIFVNENQFSVIVRDTMLDCCERLKVQRALLPSLLLEFLLVRSHYYWSRSSVVQRQIHLRILQRYLKRRECIFGMLPVMLHAGASVAPNDTHESKTDMVSTTTIIATGADEQPAAAHQSLQGLGSAPEQR